MRSPWFETRSEAARQLGVPPQSICAVINGRLKLAGGYWFTEDESEITEEKIQEIRASMYFLGGVIAVNLDSFEVLWFRSQHEASYQLDILNQYINAVVKGKQHKTHGYWFCYADENATEKARAKFGEEVARKVEELMRQNQN